MPDRPPDPFTGTDRLLIDGSNLLHALRRAEAEAGAGGSRAGGAGPAPPAAIIGRLRGAVPPDIGIELVLDGAPDPGMRHARIASGLTVRHSGRRSGDQLILDLVEDVRRAAAPGAPLDNILVVTDDRQLRHALREWGVRTAGCQWLIGRLGRARLESPTTGNRRPPSDPARATESEAAERPGWQPGRGATKKRGNPKRGHGQPS